MARSVTIDLSGGLGGRQVKTRFLRNGTLTLGQSDKSFSGVLDGTVTFHVMVEVGFWILQVCIVS